MATQLIFNSCLTNPQHKHSQLLALVNAHPAFRSKVNQFHRILQPDCSSSSLIHLGSLFFTAFLPNYPHQYVKRMAS